MALSPMMQQYFMLKEKYPNNILLFRLGDFYEMFFEDVVTVSRVLELTLTGRDCGLSERAPMCGVPYHAVDTYIPRLIEAGFKVAICEQVSDPKQSKGLVDRDVVRVVTAGTLTERSMLEEKKNNYICALVYVNKMYGIAWADISTGEFFVSEAQSEDPLNDCLALVKPTEILFSDKNKIKTKKPLAINCTTSDYGAWAFGYDSAHKSLCSHFQTVNLDRFDCGDMHSGICAAGGLLEYIKYTQKVDLRQIRTLQRHKNDCFLMLDMHTRRNLELTETLRGRGRKGTLLAGLDATKTAMGGRMLRSFLEQPLTDKTQIDQRLDGVEELSGNYSLRCALGDALIEVYDIERLATKVAYGTINPKECLSLAQSLRSLPKVKKIINDCTSDILQRAMHDINTMDEISALLTDAIHEEAPPVITEGGIFKEGYNAELDHVRCIKKNSTDYIAQLEMQERERTGIKSLKIKYNRIFGYYIEISNSFVHLAPIEYERRQTIAGGERYITTELKELEQEILGASESIMQMEYNLFCGLRDKLYDCVDDLQRDAKAVALVDVIQSFASVSTENAYTKPIMNTDGIIEIQDGRHPVVEATMHGERFVPNDTLLDTDQNRLMILTGPNMAGKSTYMRQVAIITLMAHIGCFVPARYANISITDRIFTRVGASDDLSSGQSTFMVEMNEVAGILHNCTANSLIILDEIGRGTSTFDGLSIAWAVTEHIADKEKAGCKTMFATHYHELSELEGHLDGVKNYCIQVREHGEDVIFLRKILRGSADKSFGIAVARLAGLPKDVLTRAKKILKSLEDADINKKQISANILNKDGNYGHKNTTQLSMMVSPVAQEVLDALKETDINELTPRQAFDLVCELRELAKREG